MFGDMFRNRSSRIRIYIFTISTMKLKKCIKCGDEFNAKGNQTICYNAECKIQSFKDNSTKTTLRRINQRKL